jgi:hypothetical protein
MLILLMPLAVTVILGALTLAGWVVEVTGHGKRKGAHILAYRWLTGGELDGARRTNATWTKPADKVIHPGGRAHRWHHVRRWRRGAVRSGAALTALLTSWGLLADWRMTLLLLVIAAAPLSAWGILRAVNRVRTWPHQRHYVRPLERTLARRLGFPAASVMVERDGTTVRSVAVKWAPEAEISAESQQQALAAVTTRLAIEAPDVRWELKGRTRTATFTQSEPPPKFTTWDEVAAAVAKAGPSELVFGLGKRAAVVKGSLSKDSPHIAISGGSGGGKSGLAAFLLLQELRRGAIVFNLDAKWISHLWLQGLPNVINAHEISDLHDALVWLGAELLRRTKVAYHSAGGTGRVRAEVGPRLFVLCEELNYAMGDLKDYWSELREKGDPKRSPALKALSALSCAGRASDIHLILLAQMLTAQSTGVSDSSVRGNAGIKCMARYDPNNWNMVVGRHIAMPPEPTTPGRIQVVTARGVAETQVPYLRLDQDGPEGEEAVRWAREWAKGGKVALLPSGPEGIPLNLWPPDVLGQVLPHIGAGQEPGTSLRTVPGSPPLITLRKACAVEILCCNLDAARKASQRPGFPPVRGWDGPAALYNATELRQYQEGKVRVLR